MGVVEGRAGSRGYEVVVVCSLSPTRKSTRHQQQQLTFPTSSSSSTNLFLKTRNLSSPSPPQATNSPSENDSSILNKAFSQDWNYLLKLGAGSVAAAALIKYGSVVFPEITKPNITEALIIISAPVVLSVLVLIKQSRRD